MRFVQEREREKWIFNQTAMHNDWHIWMISISAMQMTIRYIKIDSNWFRINTCMNATKT